MTSIYSLVLEDPINWNGYYYYYYFYIYWTNEKFTVLLFCFRPDKVILTQILNKSWIATMPRIKVDSRIRSLIETGVELNHRTFFFIVGQQAPNQVVHLHNMLSKTRIQSRPNMLWCYSKNLGFSTHRKKLMKKLSKKNKQGSLDIAQWCKWWQN